MHFGGSWIICVARFYFYLSRALFLKSRLKRHTSLVWLLLTWVFLAFVFPSLLGIFVSNLNPIPSVDEISMRRRAQLDQIEDEWQRGPSKKLKKSPSIERPAVARLWATYFTEINDTETQIADGHIDQQLQQVQLARDLTQISPIATFQYAMEGRCEHEYRRLYGFCQTGAPLSTDIYRLR